MIDKDNILVFDDLIPDWLMDQIEAVVPHMPLKFGHRGLGYDEGYNTFSEQWTRDVQHGVTVSHTNFLANMPWELKALWTVVHYKKPNLFKKIEGDLQLNQVQINLSTEEHYGGLHTDAPDDTNQMTMPGWIPSHTLVFFLQGDTGMEFWSSRNGELIHTVDWKKGRCVVFPSSYPHKGLPPIDVSPRVTIGFIFNGLPLQK
jgi:hypothetical protein|tara:strand:- start:35985 stop:36590 length:606 start_codon:yes stop_codon:yes gene_type:complete